MTPNSFPATPSRFRHRLLTVLLLGSVVATFTLLARNPALQGVWPWEVQASVGQMGSAIGLADYQVQIEAMPIIGVSSDVSGLTYDPDRRTLFAITNKRPESLSSRCRARFCGGCQ